MCLFEFVPYNFREIDKAYKYLSFPSKLKRTMTVACTQMYLTKRNIYLTKSRYGHFFYKNLKWLHMKPGAFHGDGLRKFERAIGCLEN